MKKSLLLIPSFAALSVAPFVGLTSCTIGGGDTPTPPEPEDAIELNTIIASDKIGPNKPISVKAGQSVTFTIHFKNFKDMDDNLTDNSFASRYEEEEYSDIYCTSINITFDNHKFKKNDPFSDYWFEFYDDFYMYDIHSPLSFSDYELGVFVVTYKEDYKNFFPFFQTGT